MNIEKKLLNNYYFSIIIPIYNSSKYLDNTLNSLINQFLSFEKYVQLILIDDGSNDNSLEICKEYQKLYPNNIIVLTQKHKGVARARNYGLNYATGKYINFLDSDDYLSTGTLYEIKYFFENHTDVDVVAIPMFYFDRLNNNDTLNYKFQESRVIDLDIEPNNPQMSISSVFIKKESINNNFSEDLICSEDILFLYDILLKKKKIGVLNLASYYYRKREDLTALSDSIEFKKEYYIPRLKKFHLFLIKKCMDNYGFIPRFIQYMLAYDLQNIIKQDTLFMCDTKEEERELLYLLRHISGYLGEGAIIYNSNIKKPLRYFFYNLRKNDLHFEFDEENVLLNIGEYTIDQLENHKVWIKKIKIQDNELRILGLFNSNFNKDYISIECEKKYSNGTSESYIANFIDFDSEKDIKYLSKTIQHKFNFILKVVLNSNSKITFKVNFHKNKDNTDFSAENLISSYVNIGFEKGTKLYDTDSFSENLFKIEKINENTLSITKIFNFSIVMAIYNTEEYLNEAIDSIINQTLDFKKNIQLILVNDGSTDSSEKICLDYEKQYPNNIWALSQKNGGQASARNYGLKYVKGKYVNFLDSDDILAENALEEILKFFEENGEKTDVASIPMRSFGRFTNEHRLNYKFNETRVIDLIKEPNNPQLSASTSFFKQSSIGNIRFPTSFMGSEDAHFTNKILLKQKTLGVISSTEYYYRRREDSSSTLDTMSNNKKFYISRLKNHFLEIINYSITKTGCVPLFIQYTLIYDLQWLVNETNMEFFETSAESQEFLYYIKKIFKFFDDDVILKNRNITNQLLKTYLLYLKREDAHIEIGNYHVILKLRQYVVDKLANHKIWLDIFEIRNNRLNISGFINSHFAQNHISIEAIKTHDDVEEHYVAKYVKYTSREDRKFLNDTWLYKYNFDVHVPLLHRETSTIMLKINYHIDGDNANFNEKNLISYFLKIDFRGHARISNISNYIVKDSHIIIFKDEKIFNIIPFSYKTMINYEKEVRKNLANEKSFGYEEALRLRLFYIILYPFIRLLKRKKKIYLFVDRLDEADDNSTHLFKYACKKRDNIKKYFVLTKKCEDYKKMSKFGTVLANKSFRHKLTYLFADKIISTHPYESGINPFFEYESEKDKRKLFNGLINSEIYFLQHGVSKDNISSWMSKFNHNLSLFATVSDKERESFLVEGYNFDEKIVQTLGFPRFDNLNNEKSKKQILIIPTWRKYLRGNKNLFINSEYFNNLNSILNNEKLLKIAKEHDYEIVFKPHPELEKFIGDTDEKYIDLFDINKEIKLSSDESYQELFKTSSLLITDYSSVFFDFAYMKKPVVYFHPNDDYHYEEGYFDYETMGFGEEIKTTKDLIKIIEKYMENDCKMNDMYKERVNNFFKYIDKNNCKRVYDWIKKH